MRFIIGLALLTAACTESITGDDDGTPPPPAGGPVQITVRDGNVPQAGIDVLFQDADDTVVLETTTNAMGMATATMTTGNVTIARTFPAALQRNPEIYTYVGVVAGDNLALGDPTDDTGTPTTINVTVPADLDGNVTITSACGSGQGAGPVITMTVAGCPASVMFFIADDGDDAGIVTAPYSANIDLSAAGLNGTLGTTFSSTDLTPDISAVDLEAYAMDGTYELYSSGSQAVDPTEQTVDLPNLSGVDELVVATISSSNGTQMESSRKPYAATPHSIDASANLLPYVANAMYQPTGVTWTETETGKSSPEFVVSTLAVIGTIKYTRFVIAPYAATNLPVPVLAGSDAIYNPNTSNTITGTLGIGAMIGGYAAARHLAFTTPRIVDGAPMNGTITLSYAGATAPTL
jgi:hypothetical protein